MLKGQKKHTDKEQGKTKHEAPRSVNYRATQIRNIIGTTALERSVVYTIGGFKCLSLYKLHPGSRNCEKAASPWDEMDAIGDLQRPCDERRGSQQNPECNGSAWWSPNHGKETTSQDPLAWRRQFCREQWKAFYQHIQTSSSKSSRAQTYKLILMPGHRHLVISFYQCQDSVIQW